MSDGPFAESDAGEFACKRGCGRATLSGSELCSKCRDGSASVPADLCQLRPKGGAMQERVRNRIIVIEALDRYQFDSDDVAAALGINKEALATFCRRQGISEIYHRLFERAEAKRDRKAAWANQHGSSEDPDWEAQYDEEFPDYIHTMVRVKRGGIWVFVSRDEVLTATPNEEYL